MLRHAYQVLSSIKLAVALFAGAVLISIPGTFMDADSVFLTWALRVLLWLMGLNLFICTLKRLKTLSKAVLVLHAGSIVTIIGCLVSTFGFVATVNISEGTSTDKVYRWDMKKDVSLGVTITVKKINTEYYPAPVRVGVFKGGEKFGLFELKTGESFSLEGLRVRADGMVFPEEVLMLSIFDGDRLIVAADTSGGSRLPQGFPYRFVLVAFKDPFLKRTWIDLKLDSGPGMPVEGASEVNNPFVWNELRFYHTNLDRDRYGFPMAGVQIVKDPGRQYVYAGFCIMGLGAAMYLFRIIYKLKQHRRIRNNAV